MARIDGILNIVVQQKATELRLGTGIVPKLFRQGSPVRFLMPETSEATLRELLGDLLSVEREAELLANSRLVVEYTPERLGRFEIAFALRRARLPDDDEDAMPTGPVLGFDVTFRRDADPPAPPPAEPAPAPAPAHAPAATQAIEVYLPTPAHAPPAAEPAAEPHATEELRALLQHAVQQRASDVHLAADEPPALRIDGRLHILHDEPTTIPDLYLAGLLTAHARAALHRGESADMALDVPALGRFRVNLYHATRGLAAAIRILPRQAPRLSDLTLPLPLDDIVDLPHGLVILTGPTGSGKSTTLAALAQEALARRPALLVSLEDPIEYLLRPAHRHALVRQRQIGRHARSFATGLRDALREDPDLILIGEMRDPETISLAITAAETGHLVLTSLHSRSAAATIERIVDAYPPERQNQIRVQLAEALRVVVAQRLLQRSTSLGRVVALEVLRVTYNVATLIREGRTAQIHSAIQAGRADGMIPLERCLADLLHAGRIDLDTARQAANDLQTFNTYLRT